MKSMRPFVRPFLLLTACAVSSAPGSAQRPTIGEPSGSQFVVVTQAASYQVSPALVRNYLVVVGIGGGGAGGGAGGSGYVGSASDDGGGGAGGAGGRLGAHRILVVQRGGIDVALGKGGAVVGRGGAGAGHGNNGEDGQPGTESSVRFTAQGDVVVFPGGAGGMGGRGSTAQPHAAGGGSGAGSPGGDGGSGGNGGRSGADSVTARGGSAGGTVAGDGGGGGGGGAGLCPGGTGGSGGKYKGASADAQPGRAGLAGSGGGGSGARGEGMEPAPDGDVGGNGVVIILWGEELAHFDVVAGEGINLTGRALERVHRILRDAEVCRAASAR